MIVPNFEIKVALLGHVSAGKTTILNALFQDKYSEVSMRRTTAGINFFRVSVAEKDHSSSTTDHDTKVSGSSKEKDPEKNREDLKWSSNDPLTVQSANKTLNTIKRDNSDLRTNSRIQEKTFDIELDEHLFEMRSDTKLVLVDIPGVNEAGSSKMYLDYVAAQWDSFDCVIVVMDAIQGVNTEEQVNLLEFVNTNLKAKKNLPIIVLCNKVDDPEDEEVAVLVGEVQDKVKQIFGTVCPETSLTDILSSDQPVSWPAFIPVSAATAFVYRTAARLELDQFSTLDKEFIDKIGKEEVGRFKWKRFSDKEKYAAVYEAVHDPSQYKERLEATNFDKFLCVLSRAVGSKKLQRDLIEKQLETSLTKLTSSGALSDQLCKIYDSLKVLNKPTAHLCDRFWELFEEVKAKALADLSDNFDLKGLHGAMDQLIQYNRVLNPKLHTGSEVLNQRDKALGAMKELVVRQCEIIDKKASCWKFENSRIYKYNEREGWVWRGAKDCWYNKHTHVSKFGREDPCDYPSHWQEVSTGVWQNKHTKKITRGSLNPAYGELAWDNMSPMDWDILVRSLLLSSCSSVFVEHFGKQKIILERLLQYGYFTSYLADSNKMNEELNIRKRERSETSSFQGSFATDGSFVQENQNPSHVIIRKLAVGIDIPKSLSDPHHWGHLSWKFQTFIKSIDLDQKLDLSEDLGQNMTPIDKSTSDTVPNATSGKEESLEENTNGFGQSPFGSNQFVFGSSQTNSKQKCQTFNFGNISDNGNFKFL
mmetsp:Transcript_3942/g.6026  ORF Transcript_3942/g.6026 Transcript_3942/m.6026 type:complete len:760 (-) Transcript_3942:120-2399(-)